MKIYLDDDGASPLLARLLRQAGHDVLLPVNVRRAGRSDQVHLAFAVGDGRVLLTKNYGDFEELHELVMVTRGHHPGIFVVRQDNDPQRDLKPAGIVRAIGNLLAAGVPIPDNYHILNHWR
jgi:hypothetical protein